MAEISAAMVKQLREKTGAGIMDCKEALTETGGDVDQAVDYLRKKGLVNKIIKGKKRLYNAESPEKLQSLLEDKQRKLEEIMPILSGLRCKYQYIPAVIQVPRCRKQKLIWIKLK